MNKISRAAYADMFGPTTGDRLRLADTDLILEVEAATAWAKASWAMIRPWIW